MSACEGRQSYDGWRRKIGSSPATIFGIVSGFFGRPASFYANRMSSRFNRGASASALIVRGQRCRCVAKKLGWTRRRVRDWINAQSGKARRQSIAGHSAVGAE
jgi:hypothetical protein